MTEWAPHELAPMPPPIVARLLVVGSMGYCSPYWATALLRWFTTSPGWTNAERPSVRTSSTRFMYLEKSITMAWFTVLPARLVPPPRGRTGSPWRWARCITCATSSADRGSTTATGSIW